MRTVWVPLGDLVKAAQDGVADLEIVEDCRQQGVPEARYTHEEGLMIPEDVELRLTL